MKHDWTVEEMERLIAAAPRTLEALEKTVAWAEDAIKLYEGDWGERDDDGHEVLYRAKVAIAEATAT